jgi:hypothetical protein
MGSSSFSPRETSALENQKEELENEEDPTTLGKFGTKADQIAS